MKKIVKIKKPGKITVEDVNGEFVFTDADGNLISRDKLIEDMKPIFQAFAVIGESEDGYLNVVRMLLESGTRMDDLHIMLCLMSKIFEMQKEMNELRAALTGRALRSILSTFVEREDDGDYDSDDDKIKIH